MTIALSSGALSDDRLRGIGLMAVAVFLFSCLDTTAKYLSQIVSPLEVSWFRFLSHMLIALAVLRPWQHLELYRTGRPVLVALRAVSMVACTALSFGALRYLALTEALPIQFATPFLVTALAGPILGEKATGKHWLAVGLGFIGVVIVANPSGGSLHPVGLALALASMASYAVYLVLTRLLGATESASSLIFWPSVLGVLALGPAMAPSFTLPPSVMVWVLLFCTGVFGGLGHFLLIVAHKMAPAPVLAPFIYAQLLWTSILAFFVFGETPTPSNIVGGVLIVLSGLYLLHLQRSRRPAA